MAGAAPTPAATGSFRGDRQRLEPISNSNQGEKCPIKSAQRAAGRKSELFRLSESKEVTRTGVGVGLSTWFNGKVIKKLHLFILKRVGVGLSTWFNEQGIKSDKK